MGVVLDYRHSRPNFTTFDGVGVNIKAKKQNVMGYFVIDRPIILSKLINVKGDIKNNCVCGIKLYKNEIYLSWVGDKNFIDADLEGITKPKCFIQRTGIGLIKNENSIFGVYAITGKELYGNSFTENRKIIEDVPVKISKLVYPHSTYHVCHIEDDVMENEILYLNLGFIKAENIPSMNFKNWRLTADLKEKFHTGYISFWYDTTIKEMLNNIALDKTINHKYGYYYKLKERILYYFDSEWCLWDSQWVYGEP